MRSVGFVSNSNILAKLLRQTSTNRAKAHIHDAKYLAKMSLKLRLEGSIFTLIIVTVSLVVLVFSLLNNDRINLSSYSLFNFIQKSSIIKTNNEKVYDRQREANDQTFKWSNKLQDWTLKSAEDNQLEWSSANDHCIWPEDCRKNDRIVNQLRLDQQLSDKYFKVLPSRDFFHPRGQSSPFKQCLVNKCLITSDLDEADAIIFQNADVLVEPAKSRRSNQIWVAYLLESPENTFDKRFSRAYRGRHEFNWTATYRSDSDIVAPYSKFVPFDHRLQDYLLLSSNESNLGSKQIINQNYLKASDTHKTLIKGKQNKVVWFASNCNSQNNRLEYARELSKYIQVDIYGKCGNFTCNKWNQTLCLQMINKNYKFYLAFENSNSREYITEKLYRNAFGYNDLDHLMLPIVLGAPRQDYEKLVPPKSFIHVDDFESAQDLANYLMLLDSDDALYYSYFRWKTMGRFIDTKFMCRVCAMLHVTNIRGLTRSYPDIKKWWQNG